MSATRISQLLLDWKVIIDLITSPAFIGGAFLLLWAVSEAIGRETWNEKFVGFDLKMNGYLFHSRVGKSVVRGISMMI